MTSKKVTSKKTMKRILLLQVNKINKKVNKIKKKVNNNNSNNYHRTKKKKEINNFIIKIY